MSGIYEITRSTASRKPAHVFTQFFNGRKWDKVFLLPRASSPPNEVAAHTPRTRNPAEPEAVTPPTPSVFAGFFSIRHGLSFAAKRGNIEKDA
jgi:hypothetical protein